MTVTFLMSAIAIGTVLLFGCIGETITEKAGHLNLGIPGIMCTGTVGGCLFVSLYMNSLEIVENASSCAMCKRMIINAGIEKVVVRLTKDEFKEIYVSEWIENDDSLSGVFGY